MSSQNKIILLISLVCGLAMPSQTIAYKGDPWYQNYKFALFMIPCMVGGVGYELRKAYKKANKEYQEKLETAGSGPLAEPKPNLPIKEFMQSKDFPRTALCAGYLAILVSLVCGNIAANAKKTNPWDTSGGATFSQPGAAYRPKYESPSAAARRKQEEEKINKRTELALARPAEFNSNPLLAKSADLFARVLYPESQDDDFYGDLLDYIGANKLWDSPSLDADMATFKAYGKALLAGDIAESIVHKEKTLNELLDALPDLKRCPEKRDFMLQHKTGDERNGSTEKTVGLLCDAQGSLVAVEKSRSEWENSSAGHSSASGIHAYYQWDDATSTWNKMKMTEYYFLKTDIFKATRK